MEYDEDHGMTRLVMEQGAMMGRNREAHIRVGLVLIDLEPLRSGLVRLSLYYLSVLRLHIC